MLVVEPELCGSKEGIGVNFEEFEVLADVSAEAAGCSSGARGGLGGAVRPIKLTRRFGCGVPAAAASCGGSGRFLSDICFFRNSFSRRILARSLKSRSIASISKWASTW